MVFSVWKIWTQLTFVTVGVVTLCVVHAQTWITFGKQLMIPSDVISHPNVYPFVSLSRRSRRESRKLFSLFRSHTHYGAPSKISPLTWSNKNIKMIFFALKLPGWEDKPPRRDCVVSFERWKIAACSADRDGEPALGGVVVIVGYGHCGRSRINSLCPREEGSRTCSVIPPRKHAPYTDYTGIQNNY